MIYLNFFYNKGFVPVKYPLKLGVSDTSEISYDMISDFTRMWSKGIIVESNITLYHTYHYANIDNNKPPNKNISILYSIDQYTNFLAL